MKYIIDCDPGIDDAIALSLGIKNNLDIIGFTATSGNVSIDKIVNNLMVIEDFLNTNIPIYKGSKNNDYSYIKANDIHGIDGLGYGVFPKCKTRKIERTKAENFIINAAKKYKDNLTLICIGPLSNLAGAIYRCPNLYKYLKHIVIMGFSYNPNSKEYYEEFNINKDLHATKAILKTPFEDIKIITHEIGIKEAIEEEYLINLFNSKDLISRFIALISMKYISFCKNRFNINGLTAPDPITIASVIKNNLIEYVPVNINIELNDNKRGICKIEEKEKSNILIAKDINMNIFTDLFKKTFK